MPRPLSPWLILSVLAFPILFVWLLLRPGYSTDVRLGGFLYAVVGVSGALAALLQGA